MARVFSAVDIEDEKLVDELEMVQKRLDLGFNPVDRDRMHITLEFFEDVGPEELEKLKRAIDGVELEPFSAEVRGVGAFPSEDYIRVVWAGVQHPKLHRLHRQVRLHGVASDSNNKFTPHITLVRVKDVSPSRKRKLQKTVQEFKDHGFGRLKVDSIKLFESSLEPEGPEYTEIYGRRL